MVLKRLAPIAIASLIVVGCSEQSSSELMSKAEKAIVDKNYQEAEIFLKSAVSSDLENQAAHLQLANVYYFQGQFDNAIKQYNKIDGSDLFDAESLRFWLQSLLFSEERNTVKKVLSEYPDEIAPAVYEYYAYKSRLSNDENFVDESLSEANSLSKLTRCISKEKRTEVVSDCLKSIMPSTEPEVLYEVVKTSIRQNDLETFLSSIASLSAVFPKSELFQMIHSEALVRNRMFEDASLIIRPLIKKYPNQAFLNHLSAVIAFEKQNFVESKLKSEKALQRGFKNKNVRLIAAMSAFYLEDFEQAYNHFEAVAGDIDTSSPEYRIYTSTLLALGYTYEATEAIKSIGSVSVDDLPLVSSTANVLASIKNEAEAISLLELFDEIVDGQSESYVLLNLQKLALDDVSALSNLESLNENEDDMAVKVGLASYYLSNNEFSKALMIAEEMAQTSDGVYTSKVIEALVAFRSNSADTSEKFGKLLELDEFSIPALFYFTNYYADKGQLQDAKEASKKLLQVIPRSVLAISEHIRVLSELGKREALIDFLVKAHEANSNDANVAALYAAELLKEGMVSKAHAILNSYPLTVNNKPLFWITLINATSLKGDTKGAKTIAKEWLALVPHYKPAILLAANVHEKHGDVNTSIDILKKGERHYPSDYEIKLLLASNYLNIGRISSAKQKLNELNPEVKNTLPYYFVEGQIALEEGHYEDAKRMLGRYFEKHKSYDAFVLLINALRALNETSEAVSVAEKYLQENHNDKRVSLFLAELYIQTDHKKAIAQYERLLKEGEAEAFLLNNLAWLYHVNGKSEQGLEYAKSAVDRESNNAEYLDTLGMIQLRLGRQSESVVLLEQAFELTPQNTLIALHYAEALVLVGQKRRAEIVLAPYLKRSNALDKEIQRVLNGEL